MIRVKDNLTGELNTSIVHVYPDLENLEVTPSLNEQEFKPTKYGYEKVNVKRIPAEDLNVKPLETEQIKEGLYKTVNVEAIQTEEITPNIDFANSDKVEFTPTTGKYIKKVTINKPASLVAENIKSGIGVFGVNGNLEVLDTTDATATAGDILKNKTAYVNGKKVIGTLEVSADTNNARIYEGYLIANNKTQLTLAYSLEHVDFSGIDASRYTSFMNMFQAITSLRSVVLPKQTSQVTTVQQMFYYCTVLEDVPCFDASGVTNMTYFVQGATTNLTDESLNNILAICASATKMKASEKKLSTLGEFTTEQINKMKTMSNYQAFVNAGWSTN